MLKWLRGAVIAIAGVLLVIAIDFLVCIGCAHYQAGDYYAYTKYCEENCALLRGPVFIFIGTCLARFWHFIHGNHEELIAVATVTLVVVTAALAYYTWGLWTETVKLGTKADATAEQQKSDMRESLRTALVSANAAAVSARAASKQVKAAVNVERPFVYARHFVFQRIDTPNFGLIPPERWKDFPEIYDVMIRFKNYGRTPAFIVGLEFGHCICAVPPDIPHYGLVPEPINEAVVDPGAEHYEKVDRAIVINPKERQALDSGSLIVWVWGRISYRDFFNGIAASGFIASHIPSVRHPGVVPSVHGQFRFGGPSAYSRQSYKESDA